MVEDQRTQIWKRIAAAIGIAALYSVLCYFLIDWLRPDSGYVTATFALIQPAVICAFVAYIGDPLGVRKLRFYLLVPVALAVGMVMIAAIFLQEGVICIVMLTPIWLISGEVGSFLVYKLRPDRPDMIEDAADTFRASVLLLIPLVLMPLEQQLAVPGDRYTVSRSIEIEGTREDIWQMMQTIPTLSEGEGAWNITQNMVGVPRPIRAQLVGEGKGAIRMAEWGQNIAFQERITDWQAGERIHWDFEFPDNGGWDFTDRHLRPDSTYMRIETGGYALEELDSGQYRLTLATTYAAQTHFNFYAAWWGELFLGDIQTNLLAAIRTRAEL